jgi:phosphoribosyl-AMP cyclohydrolase
MSGYMTEPDAIEAVVRAIAFDERGLAPVIAQRHDSGEVLMLAWMNEAAVRETLATGRVCYWSRSRQALWRKGETSGHVQRLIDFRIDCDNDTILLLVEQTGPACHTNRPNCFFRAVRDGQLATISEPVDAGSGKKS